MNASRLLSLLHASAAPRWAIRAGLVSVLVITPVCFAQHAAQSDSFPESTLQQESQKPYSSKSIGASTTSLLNMQVEGKHAGKGIPMLGSTATLSWQRYQNSFKHEIPESFAKTVKTNSSEQ